MNEAREWLDILKKFDVQWLEEPLRVEDESEPPQVLVGGATRY
jgi:L-alanine-DL-glutamate epimerase-like enolase superfamily enzyme